MLHICTSYSTGAIMEIKLVRQAKEHSDLCKKKRRKLKQKYSLYWYFFPDNDAIVGILSWVFLTPPPIYDMIFKVTWVTLGFLRRYRSSWMRVLVMSDQLLWRTACLLIFPWSERTQVEQQLCSGAQLQLTLNNSSVLFMVKCSRPDECLSKLYPRILYAIGVAIETYEWVL